MLKRFAACLGLLLAAGAASAAPDPGYPSRPVQLVVPFSAGGGNDIVARLLAKHLAPRFRAPFVVENKPGAGGNIGMAFVSRAAPDGYTLAYASNGIVMNPYLYRELGFDVQKDFEPIAMLATTPIWVLVNADQPMKSLAELVAHAKRQPGRLAYATPGIGTPHHLATELLKNMTGTDLVHVPYKGASGAATDAVSGRVPVLISTPASIKGFVQAGRLRPLATMDPRRGEGPDALPAVSETVPGFDVTIWHGLLAPAGTPAAVVSTLSEALRATLADPAFKADLAAAGFTPAFADAADMKQRIAAELGVWRDVTRKAGITPE